MINTSNLSVEPDHAEANRLTLSGGLISLLEIAPTDPSEL